MKSHAKPQSTLKKLVHELHGLIHELHELALIYTKLF